MIRLTIGGHGPLPDEIMVGDMTYIPVVPIKRGQATTITEAEIDAAKTPAGGWTQRQLADWGVPWPPPKGWKKRLLAEGVR